jgi:hypothetical protein
MTNYSFLGDDALIDALMMEIASLLRNFIDNREHGGIDLLGMPLSPECLAALEARLGSGEVTIRLDAAGRSESRETGFAGVWWTSHCDEAGRRVALLIEVAPVPDIVPPDICEIEGALSRLTANTNFAVRRAGNRGTFI